MKNTIAILLLILMLTLFGAHAEEIISPEADFYYYDEVGILSEETKGEIFYSNKLLYDDCGAQIVVAIINSTGKYSSEEYSIKLFNKWGIGDSEKNNGFLLLLAIQDDDYYACPGEGLEPLLPAATIKEMFDLYLEDDFAAKRYEDGAKKFFEEVFKYIAEIYHSDVTIQDGIHAYNSLYGKTTADAIDLSGMSWDELMTIQQRIVEEMQQRTESGNKP